ncbi:MAG TPA: HlyD family efflux transporter periplasmic adaptor subunit [Burkholderiaceae bacterium]|nr:HlyD family efflux transporter periplasmic adaptor subunit [Burkholderiaceae bacterium]
MTTKRTLAVSIAAGVALIAALAWAFRPRPVDVETASAVVGRFEATIDEDAKTRVADRYVVSAPLAGHVARIALREGDAVEAGAVVATLTPVLSPLLDERSLREAGARVEAAQAQLARAGVRIERARVGVEQARLELRRSEQLAKDGFVAPTKLDGDRLAAQAAAKEQETAVQERHIAEHDLQQARAALSALRQPAAGGGRSFAVRSPVAGRLLRVVHKSEGTVALGTPLIEVGDTDRLEIVAELLTTDALRAAPGTRVRIERWGGPGELEGRVRRVEPAAFTKVSALGVEEQRVNVIVDLASPRSRWQALGDGFGVGVRIVVLAADQALQIPGSAVFPLPAGEDHQMAVFVVDNGRARLTPVTLEARNGSMAWIGKGLDAGAKVIVYPPTAVIDGVRVRERKV